VIQEETMANIIQVIPKDPDPDKTLEDVLDDIVELTSFNHKLLSYDNRTDEVELVYQPPT
jgi:hypothetical protein